MLPNREMFYPGTRIKSYKLKVKQIWDMNHYNTRLWGEDQCHFLYLRDYKATTKGKW